MSRLALSEKLAILSDAARYDASCASSGTQRRDSRDGKGLGSTEGSGISLLKILMTNFYLNNCAYCINRVSSNVQHAQFPVDVNGASKAVLLRVPIALTDSANLRARFAPPPEQLCLL